MELYCYKKTIGVIKRNSVKALWWFLLFELFSFVLEFNQYMKSDKMPHIIYADSESPIEKYITVKTIQKNLKQKKYEIIFLADI